MKFSNNNDVSDEVKAQAIEMFVNAIEYCDYDDIVSIQNYDAICSYAIMSDNNINCIICLVLDNDGFFVAVTHSYYSFIFRLIDMDEYLMAYFIRNATKPIDDYSKSFDFFTKFFNQFQAYQNVESFSMIVEHAAEQMLDLTFIDPTFHVDKSKKGAYA